MRRATARLTLRPPVTVTVAAAVALGVCAYATTMPWLSAGIGDDPRVFSGSDLAPLAWTVRVLCALTLSALLVTGVWGLLPARLLAMAGAASVALLAGALIGTLETVAALMPDSLLPATIRRVSILLRAGEGLWVMLAASLVALLVAVPWKRRRPRLLRGRIRAAVVIPPALLLTLTLVFAALRYEPWMAGAAGGREFTLEAWATPWIGPLSLAIVWLLAASCLIALLGARWVAGLLAACAGWAMTFLASLAVAASATLGGLHVDTLVPAEWREYAPAFEAVPGAWLVYAAGLTAAALGAALIAGADHAPEPPTEEAAWPLP